MGHEAERHWLQGPQVVTDLRDQVLAVFKDAQLGYDPSFCFDSEDAERPTGEWSTIDAATHQIVDGDA